jgi:hypothetical protein
MQMAIRAIDREVQEEKIKQIGVSHAQPEADNAGSFILHPG